MLCRIFIGPILIRPWASPQVGSSFSALRHPDSSAYDALDATLAAGVCASDADANARGELCAIHALAATMVGCREVSFPMACRVLLPPVLRVWAEEEDGEWSYRN